MKEKIKEFLLKEYGDLDNEHSHFSYCSYPFEDCSCERLENIDYDTSLITGGYLDSFSMVNVLVFLEKEFKVDIPDVEATPDNFNTINKMVELVNKFKNV